MHSVKLGSAEKEGGGTGEANHHIFKALITSTLLPCVVNGFSGARSGGSALFIPPTYSVFFFSFCHSRACVINLLSADANRTPQFFFFNVTGARWRQLNFCFGKLVLSFLQMLKLLSQFVCKKKDPARPIVLVHVSL